MFFNEYMICIMNTEMQNNEDFVTTGNECHWNMLKQHTVSRNTAAGVIFQERMLICTKPTPFIVLHFWENDILPPSVPLQLSLW